MMSWDEIGDTPCPIARTLAVVGDRWTMLIVRELFTGTRRFEDFQAQTGISPHLLSTRLKRLEADGIVRRQAYSAHPPRHEYRLTEKGLDLYPLILGLRAWGEKWGGFPAGHQPALRILHKACGHETGFQFGCAACGLPYGARDTKAVMSDDFAAARATRHQAFHARKTNDRG